MIDFTRSAALFPVIDTVSNSQVAGGCCPVRQDAAERSSRPAYFPGRSPVLPPVPKPDPPVEPVKTGGVIERIEEVIEWIICAVKSLMNKLSDVLSGVKQLPAWMRWF